jgi:capsular exopolysaccharide synthesis family protein
MSRIFDALQRSGAEQSGIEYPDMMSVATAVFEAPRERVLDEMVKPVDSPQAPGADSQDLHLAAAATIATTEKTNEYQAFPSLDVSVAPDSRLVFFSHPESLAAEKFRFLAVRLRQIRQSRQLKKVLVTSTIPEEGKSLVSANLAGVLARRKEKVLLIDGDLRRPVLAQNLGLGKLAGLTESLQGSTDSLSNIYRLNGPGFWIMPAGRPPENPLELMQSGRLSALFSQLTALFDWVIVDSPPLLPLADTTVWSRFTDGTLLVVREGKTEKKLLERALAVVKESDLIGVVLNGCSDPVHDYYYSRYSNPASK